MGISRAACPAALEPGSVQRAMDPIVDQIARRRARQRFRFRTTVVLTWIALIALLVGGLWLGGKIDLEFLRTWQAYILAVASADDRHLRGFHLLRLHPGDSGALWTAVVERGDLRDRQLLRLAGPRHAAHCAILFIYLALPQIYLAAGIPLIFLGIFALSFNYGAYMTEIFRRDPGNPAGSDRGRALDRHDRPADDAPGRRPRRSAS